MAPKQTHCSSKLSLFIAIITIIFLTNPSPATSSSPDPKFSKIYAFGDSYTDTGNVHTALPNGMTFFHRRSDRLSDGRLVIDFVAESLSLPYLPPYLDHRSAGDNASVHGVNFAVSGSTAIDHEFYVKNNISLPFTPCSIGTQLEWFNEFLESRGCGSPWRSSHCDRLMDGSLFWVGEIGANDYAYAFGSSVSPDTVKTLSVNSVTHVLQTLLKMGAKHIIVQGLNTIGCLPLSLTLASRNDRDDIGCVASANTRSFAHNSLLQSKLQQFRTQFPQTVLSYADHWNAYRTVMKNPEKYGFKEPFKACCGSGSEPYNLNMSAFCGSASARACSDPREFISWDGVHLTEAMYSVIADMFLHHGLILPSFL